MKKLFFVLFFLLPLAGGCAYVEPLIQGFNIVSPAEESQIGAQVAAQVSKEMKIQSGTSQEQTVRQIGNQLVSALARKDYNYKFYVVDDPTPNAFTIPGGTIYVHTGLLSLAAGDRDELAGVIAHEIGHAYERHPAKGISRQYGVEYLSQLLFKENQSKLKQFSLQLAKQSILTRYGREDELAADQVGYELLGRAGFKTDGLIRFFKKLQQVSQGGNVPAFLSTHPPTPERIARLEALDRNRSTLGLAAPAVQRRY